MTYAPYPDCQCGTGWFPDRDSALLFTSDLTGWGVVLEATESDDIAAIWPVLCAMFISPKAHMAVEVFDVTDGFPLLDALSVSSYFPTSDLFTSDVFAWNGSALLSAAQFDAMYPQIDNTVLVPGMWPSNNRPIGDTTFLLGIYGSGYEYAFKVGNLAGNHAGQQITRLTMAWTAARLSEDKEVNAITLRPYITIAGNRYIGEWETLATDDTVEFETHWWANPRTGGPWTATDLDRFDWASGASYGLGFIVDGTGSANTVAMVQQARLDVQYAPTEPREVVGAWEILRRRRQGWQRIVLRDPDSGAPANLSLVPGRRYLFAFRKTSGHGTALCRLDQPGGDGELTFQPKWSSSNLTVDAMSHRVIAMGATESVVMGMALQTDGGGYSLDSQVYASTSPEGLDSVDAWPDIGAYFRMSPVDETHRVFQRFTPDVSDVYSWLRLNVATAVGVVDDDLYVVVRDAATNTDQHTPQRVTVDDLTESLSKVKWQTIGLRLDDPPVLNAGTQYVFALYSATAHRRGWLVQVSNGGFPTGPPTGPPTGALPAVFGGQNTPPDILQLWDDGVLTDWAASTAQVQVATQPDPPSDLVVIDAAEVCNIAGATIVWTAPDVDDTCGGLAAVSVERSDDQGATWHPICHIADPAVEMFDDWELHPNRLTLYRARALRGDGVWSEYTAPESVEVQRQACGLAFTSNESPHLNVFYPDIESPRRVSFPRDEAEYAPHNRDFFVVHSGLENRGSRFSTTVMVRADGSGGQPCAVDDCHDWDLMGVDVFSPLLAIARADLSYVCVTNEHGNRWFAHVSVSEGVWDAEVDLFTATLEVVPVTDVPSQPDAAAGS